MSDVETALARTALLIRLDVFGSDPGTESLIVDGLRNTTALVVADRRNLGTIGGQTALVTLHNQLVMLGLQVDLDVPTVPLIARQSPLRDGDLARALHDYSDDLIPGGSSHPASAPDVMFALGDTPAPPGAIRLDANQMEALVDVGNAGAAGPWAGDPIVGVAAAAAAAADGVRAAIPRIAERLDRHIADLPPQWLPVVTRSSRVNLSHYAGVQVSDLGQVDCISGGAITQAALYVLLRIPGLRGDLRVIEPELLDLTNLNRYPLARGHLVGEQKTDILADLATESLHIAGLPHRFVRETLPFVAPLNPRVLVGVDHIPSRWTVQQSAADATVIVGASSHDYVLVSAHPSGAPCAGCVHPRDEQSANAIPTIGFVSLWAGVVAALELLRSYTERDVDTYANHIWPLGLHNPRGVHRFRQARNRDCPLRCAA